jgi:hypothetical protein
MRKTLHFANVNQSHSSKTMSLIRLQNKEYSWRRFRKPDKSLFMNLLIL